MGTAGFACPSLAALDASTMIDVIGVVTQPDRPKGRQLIPHPPAVKVEAENRKLSVHQPFRLKNDFIFLNELNPELIVVAAYGQILPQAILDYQNTAASMYTDHYYLFTEVQPQFKEPF